MTRDEFLVWAPRFPEALMLVDQLEGRVVAANPACCELLEKPEQAVASLTLFDLAESPPELVRQALATWARAGRMVYGSSGFTLASGEKLRFEGAVLRPASGEVTGLLLVRAKRHVTTTGRFLALNQKIDQLLREVHGRMRAEDQVRRQRKRLEVTLSSIDEAVIATDVNGNVELINEVAERFTGWRAEEAYGQPVGRVLELFEVDSHTPLGSLVERISSGGPTAVGKLDAVLRSRSGLKRPVEGGAAPIRDAAGESFGVVIALRDVSVARRARGAAERARDEAVAASRAKDDFLAALSHELRTPLNPILLIASERAKAAGLPDLLRDDFKTIERNARQEARIVDDLLDLTRIIRGKMHLECDPIDLHGVLEEAVALARGEAEAKSISLDTNFQGSPPIVWGDPVRLQQIFGNILNNAIKFTDCGGRIFVESTASDTGEICQVRVSDTGIGMTPAELESVFESFVQGGHAASGSSHRFGGLGLGLAISRRLVEEHQGSIEATSPGPGHGTTFTITLPQARESVARQARRKPPMSAEAKPIAATVERHVLLVEDHEATRLVVGQLLTTRGCRVTSAGSAAEALDAAENDRFDLVIADIGLPDADGYELMMCLRKRHGLTGIAVSGYGTSKDIARSRAAGFISHLVKPIDIEALDAVLRANFVATANTDLGAERASG